MEKSNGAMGLEETIDSTTKKATSESNGIDVHMIKTTEWGTVAILSASGYGNAQKMQNSTIKSTTGNKSGVYFPLNAYEVTAGGYANPFSETDSKYYDSYTVDSSSAKIGDALGTCAWWHNSRYAAWVNGGYPYCLRGVYELFSYGVSNNGYASMGRSAIVCGEGF